MDKNLARWTFASIAQYFSTYASTLGLEFFVEGINERDVDNMQKEHVELRVDGPYVKHVSSNCYLLHVGINLILTDYMQMSSENAYSLMDWGGTFLNAMLSPIPIYRYGSGVGDDSTLVGCLTQRTKFAEPTRLLHFGQRGKTERFRQSMVDGRYELLLIL